MLNRHAKAQAKVKYLFSKIYHLAKKQDKESLTKLIQSGVCIGIRYREYSSPITLLAKRGQYNAVDFLIDEFKASPNHAVLGYAEVGDVHHVNQMIARGASKDFVVMGFAMGGHVEQVNDLLKRGAMIDAAIAGYAYRGNAKQVDLLLAQGRGGLDYAVKAYARRGYTTLVDQMLTQGASIDQAVYGYGIAGNKEQLNQLLAKKASINAAVEGCAFGHHTRLVDKLIAQGASRTSAIKGYARSGYVDEVNLQIAAGGDKHYALWGYAIAGHIEKVNQEIQSNNAFFASDAYARGGYLESEEAILFLVANSDNATLQKQLFDRVRLDNDALDTVKLKQTANKIKQIMTEYHLPYQAAKTLLMTGPRAWLLQGPELIRDNRLPAELFYQVTSCLTGLSIQEADRVSTAINDNLADGAKKIIESKFKGGLFSEKRRLEEIDAVDEHYTKRLRV